MTQVHGIDVYVNRATESPCTFQSIRIDHLRLTYPLLNASKVEFSQCMWRSVMDTL